MTPQGDSHGPKLRGRRASIREAVAAMLWPVPTLIIVLVVAAGVLLPRLDTAVDSSMPNGVRTLVFGGGPAEARQLLTAIASGLITTVSLVFSLTVVVFQLASSQYSPRLLRVFSRDGLIRATLGVLVGSFVYALTVLRTVRAHTVPRIATTFGFVLTLGGAVLLVIFLGHVVTELRVETMLRRVHREQRRISNRVLGAASEYDGREGSEADLAGSGPDHIVVGDKSGFVTAVDEAQLLRAATATGFSVRLLRRVGDSVTAGSPLAAYRPLESGSRHAGGSAPDHQQISRSIRGGVVLGYERTGTQDVSYGIQQLVDVYVKALSPGINDPSTAAASLSHVAGVLAEIARRPLQDRRLADDEGRIRVVVPVPTFSELLELALGPVRTYGSKDVRIVVRAADALRDVAWATRPGRRHDAIRLQLDRTLHTAVEQLSAPGDRERATAAIARARDALTGHWE